MGGRQSTTIRVTLIGPAHSGKTQFLDWLTLGGDTTLRPTNGKYEAAYIHKGVPIQFTEYGSAQRAHWTTLFMGADALMVFLGRSQNYYAMTGHMLDMLAAKPCRIVAVVVPSAEFVKPAIRAFQLHLLAKCGYQTHILTLNYDLPELVEVFLDILIDGKK